MRDSFLRWDSFTFTSSQYPDESAYANGDRSLIDDEEEEEDEPISITDSCYTDEGEAAPPAKPRSRPSSSQAQAGRRSQQPVRRVVKVSSDCLGLLDPQNFA